MFLTELTRVNKGQQNAIVNNLFSVFEYAPVEGISHLIGFLLPTQNLGNEFVTSDLTQW